jgi:hypothetical protein
MAAALQVRRAGLALGLVLIAAAPAPARAQQAGVSMTPAIVERDLSSRAVSAAVRVANGDPAPHDLTVEVTGLTHDLDGNPSFPPDPRAANALHPDVAAFTLAPGASREVTVTGSIPAGAGGIDAGLVVAVVAPSGGQIGVRSEVAASLLFRGPKPWREAIQVEAVQMGAPARAGGPVPIGAVVRNTGDVHGRPTGTARITYQGAVLATVELHPQLVLPGSARRLTGVWNAPAGLTGTVQLDADFTQPPGHGAQAIPVANGAPERPTSFVTTTTTTSPPPRPAPRHTHSWLALLAGAVLLAAAAAGAYRRLRRRV